MKKSMSTNTLVLAALVCIATGCTGQPNTRPFDRTPTTQAVVAPFDLGMSTYLNKTPVKIVYDLDSRFILTVTKERLRAARTIHDIVPGHLEQDGVSYTAVSIRILEGEQRTDIVEVGEGHELNAAQLKLLRSLDYSSNFMIRATYSVKNRASGTSTWEVVTPHVTVVPEQEAMNSNGMEAMIEHVKQGTSDFPYIVDAEKLQPGKVFFTVNEVGALTDVRLTGSAGYPALDARVLELVNTFPGTWAPATNAAGQPVPQEFMFSFGTVGC